jgi:hypothetical protein
MPLPAAPASAIRFLMAGPQEIAAARAVPSSDHFTGPMRDAARAARRAVTQFDQIHAHGRALVDRRREVHAADERNAARAMGAGKQLGEAKLLAHDDEIADQAERLNAAAGAVVNAVRDLDAIAPEQWEKAADRIARQVAQHVGQAEDALATARASLQAVDAIANVRAWAQRRGGTTGPDPHVAQAIDALDHAQERVAVVRDGEAPPVLDPGMVPAPVHAGMSSAWREAVHG